MDGALIAAISTLCAAGVAIALAVRQPLRRLRRANEEASARTAFRQQREVLEAKFFDLAARSGKPRGLKWIDVEFLDDLGFARDRQTGLLAAFVSVNIRFEAIPGGDMEDVAAVGNVRDACALFHYEAGGWGTGGKTLFNVSPREAIARFHTQFEPLAESVVPAV
ncbi:MAG: hypothetical protein NT069_08795 [Planctomycetota bacterium]|nr:hypothetical protein [Planctomycetota bacterium]